MRYLALTSLFFLHSCLKCLVGGLRYFFLFWYLLLFGPNGQDNVERKESGLEKSGNEMQHRTSAGMLGQSGFPTWLAF